MIIRAYHKQIYFPAKTAREIGLKTGQFLKVEELPDKVIRFRPVNEKTLGAYNMSKHATGYTFKVQLHSLFNRGVLLNGEYEVEKKGKWYKLGSHFPRD